MPNSDATPNDSDTIDRESIELAAKVLNETRSLVITAGAGMGVDSGLPDFRGDQGFWRAYPAYEKLGLPFMDLANPKHFESDPTLGWGFYGHRANLYRDTIPHEGFSILLNWIQELKLNWFVATSNVDGQFQKAGFNPDHIVEVHGSIHHMQCQAPCKPVIWERHEVLDIDMSTMRSKQVPMCKHCDKVARPNILMFNDWWWIPVRSNAQQKRFDQFVEGCAKPITVVEMGAGKAIPTIRYMGEDLGRRHGARVIRINPREAQIAEPHISIFGEAAATLRLINGAR